MSLEEFLNIKTTAYQILANKNAMDRGLKQDEVDFICSQRSFANKEQESLFRYTLLCPDNKAVRNLADDKIDQDVRDCLNSIYGKANVDHKEVEIKFYPQYYEKSLSIFDDIQNNSALKDVKEVSTQDKVEKINDLLDTASSFQKLKSTITNGEDIQLMKCSADIDVLLKTLEFRRMTLNGCINETFNLLGEVDILVEKLKGLKRKIQDGSNDLANLRTQIEEIENNVKKGL